MFITETEECEYVFNWKTPSACALGVHDGGKDAECEVYDPKYGVLYILQDLVNSTLSLKDGSKLVIGFCEITSKPCENIACLLKDGMLSLKPAATLALSIFMLCITGFF